MVLLGLIFILTFAYGYLNGVLASASIVAAAISSGAMNPRTAFWLAAISMFIGPFLLGTAVASTIGAELIAPEATTLPVIGAALGGAIVWSSFTLWLKLPMSISHALIGGLIGAAWAGFGYQAILMTGLTKTLLGLFLSPFLGLIAGFVIVKLCYFAFASSTPRINQRLKQAQIVLSFLLAISFSANNGQKIMGIMILTLVAGGFLNHFSVPLWVVAFSAASVGLGSFVGSLRLIRTMGGKFYKLRPVHGFSVEFASDLVLFGAALLGGPVSGSQVVTSAIVGAGSADRIQKVRWGVLKNIFAGWLLTIPLSALVSAIGYLLIKGFTA